MESKQLQGAKTLESGRTEEQVRMARQPVGASSLKLTRADIPGMKTRWFLDQGSRVEQALMGGWRFVDRDETVNPYSPLTGEGKRPGDDDVIRHLGNKKDGQWLVLMAIEEGLYEQDQKTKSGELDETFARLRNEPQKDDGSQYAMPELTTGF